MKRNVPKAILAAMLALAVSASPAASQAAGGATPAENEWVKKLRAETDAFVTKVNSTPSIPPDVAKYFLGEAERNRALLPRQPEDAYYGLARITSKFAPYPAYIAEVTKFRKQVVDENSPDIMRKQVLGSVDQIISNMLSGSGPETYLLDQTMRAYRENMRLVKMVDQIAARVPKEVPAAFPQFTVNTLKEIAAARKIIGNPAGAASEELIDGVRFAYETRLVYVKIGAQVQAKINSTNSNIAYMVSNAAFQARLIAIMINMVDYHAGSYDPYGMGDLKRDIDARK
jgi:hypothetical protein